LKVISTTSFNDNPRPLRGAIRTSRVASVAEAFAEGFRPLAFYRRNICETDIVLTFNVYTVLLNLGVHFVHLFFQLFSTFFPRKILEKFFEIFSVPEPFSEDFFVNKKCQRESVPRRPVTGVSFVRGRKAKAE
jgi:hypothetical protein